MSFITEDLRNRCPTCGEPPGAPNFEYLRNLAPRGILPCDTDGEVEMSGNFLFIEQKRQGEKWTKGQWLCASP